MNSIFNGIFAALTTPFEGNDISPQKLKENIHQYNQFALSGYVILGSTGESVFLSEQESEMLVKTAVESASPEKKIIAGTARESVKNTLEFTNKVAELGIDAALVRTPSYYKKFMTRESLKNFYLSIADQSRVPVLIYNIPQNTGISIDPELVLALSQHPNIAGLKESAGNLSFMGEVIPHLGQNFSFLTGAGSSLLPSLTMGASGGILALASAAPFQCTKIYSHYQKGEIKESLQIQLNLIPLNKAIIQTFGIPGLKHALDLLGYYGGPPRLPLLPLDEKGKSEIESILKNSGLLKN